MPLTINQTYSNSEVRAEFACSMMGGMNKSNSTNTLVLVLKHINNFYEDRQEGDIVYYTGKGQLGNQELKGDNRTLAESRTNGVRVVLLEVFKKKEYIYRGDVELVAAPHIEKQLDAAGQERNVFIFPLKLQEASRTPLDFEVVAVAEQDRERRTRRLSNEELQRRLKHSQRDQPGYTYTRVKSYQRSVDVVEAVLRRANGTCELCEEAAPFHRQDGTPYLEVHHIIQLAKGGADKVTNAVALCPNCHRKMHSLNLEIDRRKLKAKASF